MHGRLPDQPALPWRGTGPIPAQCSYAGARSAQPRAQAQADRYLAILRYLGAKGLTDLEAAALLQIPVTSVCARRNMLRRKGLVTCSGSTRPGPTGTKNTVWIAKW